MACKSSELLSKHVERILDALPEGVFISDASGTSLRVNRMYEQLTGLTQEQIRGKNVRDLVQEGTFDCILNPEIVRTGRPTTHVREVRLMIIPTRSLVEALIVMPPLCALPA